jgi:protein-S-isoprenylcysteine O-methyltransferase Ste14
MPVLTVSPLVAAIPKPYFETHHLLGTIWIVLAVATFVIELAGFARQRPEATSRDSGSWEFARICQVPAIVMLILSPKILPSAEIHPAGACLVAAVVALCAGEGLRIWAKVALGRYFTYTVMTSNDQPVITNGPYRAVRHPSYTGLLLIVIGLGAAWGNWLGLGIAFVLSFVGLRYRIYVEEKALLGELGENYRAYAERHKRLVPFVW